MRLLCALLIAFSASGADQSVAIAPASLFFACQVGGGTSAQAIILTSPQSGTFTATRPVEQAWLELGSGSAASGTLPTLLPVGASCAGMGQGTYTSAIAVRVAEGTAAIPVTLAVSAQPVLGAFPGYLEFEGLSSVFPSQTFGIAATNNASLQIISASASPWLTVQGSGNVVQVAANLGKAAAGVLNSGFVTITALAGTPLANNPLTLPIFYRAAGAASRGPLTIDPGALTFTGPGRQTLAVTPAGIFTASATVQSGAAGWLGVSTGGQTATVTVSAAGLAAGTYQGTVQFTANGVIQPLPVALNLASPVAPNLVKLVGAASYAEGGIAPGEVVTLGGTNLGPASLAGLALNSNGNVASTLSGVQVLFSGIPAPMIFASATQLAAVAPYELDGSASTTVQVTVNGQPSNTISVPVVAAAPEIFTSDASGAGPGAILNADYSLNGPAHPAAKGETVALYATGEGQTMPAGADGKVTATPPVPRLPVTVTIGGQQAQVTFAGEAPGIVSGVMQVNLQIPAGAGTGELPLVLYVGGVSSQTGVTVSVR